MRANQSPAEPSANPAVAPVEALRGVPAPPDVEQPPADAARTASGLASKVLIPGRGADHPGLNDSVNVNYSGWTTDGKMFDSSVAPPQPGREAKPVTFSLARVLPGWTEGVRLNGASVPLLACH